jgi:hypothetical protein
VSRCRSNSRRWVVAAGSGEANTGEVVYKDATRWRSRQGRFSSLAVRQGLCRRTIANSRGVVGQPNKESREWEVFFNGTQTRGQIREGRRIIGGYQCARQPASSRPIRGERRYNKMRANTAAQDFDNSKPEMLDVIFPTKATQQDPACAAPLDSLMSTLVQSHER